MRYPVTLTRDDNDTFLATFPDLPGAVTYGETREEALARAQDAFATVVEALMKDRRDIPTPSTKAGSGIELPALMAAKLELYRTMREQSVGKSELGKRLDWHLPQVDRLLAMRHGSQLDQMEEAFAALGKRLVVSVVDAPRAIVKAPQVSSRVGPRLRMRRARSKRAVPAAKRAAK